MPKAVIFDMDGVIIDSEPVHYNATKEYLKELGLEIGDEEYRMFIGTTNREIYSRLKSKYNLSETVDSLVSMYERRYMEYLKSLTDEKPIPGVLFLLEGIKGMGYPMALASSASMEEIQTVLKYFCIESFFQVVVSGCQVERPKPSPDVFVYAADLLKVKPSDCIVIEDSCNGVKAAKAAGMRCIAFENPNTGEQDLSLADIIVNNFDSRCLAWIREI